MNKNLGKAIDKIIKIEPSLEPHLIPIKNKWAKFPQHTNSYWKQFLDVLNGNISIEHPKRDLIKNVLTPPAKQIKKTCTFEEPSPQEHILGVIPENIECQLRKHDKKQIELAKKNIEARMTHNVKMLVSCYRDTEFLEIAQKKIWAELKDHFKIWSMEGPITYLIRCKGPVLVLTAIRLDQMQNQGQNPPPPPTNEPMPDNYIIRMDPELLRKFFKYFNITPPPGIFPPE